ncbi:hypothetical protein [Kitasatospora purpeofusca]|uniref:hypothetical protein n=1 Tax=Kitasatospora purpeofusca TaxID=67352 RepID=UPI0036D39FBF
MSPRTRVGVSWEEGLDVVGLLDDVDGVVSGDVGDDLGRGDEPVRRGDGGRGGVDRGEQLGPAEGVLFQESVGGCDLDGGGILTAEQDGLLRAAGQVAELGVLDGGELGGGLGEDDLGEVGVSSRRLWETSIEPPLGRFGLAIASGTSVKRPRSCSLRQPSELGSREPAALAGWV